MTKRQNIVMIGAFLAMIFGFTAGSLLIPSKEFSEKENRTLQQLPKVRTEEVLDGSFARKYEKYLSDQFFARDRWIAVKTAVDRLTGKQEGNGIYFAKDGYLIEAHKDDFKLKSATENLQTVADFIESWKDVYDPEHMQVCLVPNAVDIYPEKLPPFAVNTVEKEYLEKAAQIIAPEYMLDAEELLLAHKDEQLFYRTDHHWTTKASRYVYEAWAQKTNLEILPLDAYEEQVLTDAFYGTIDAKVSTSVKPDQIIAYLPKQPVYYNLQYGQSIIRDSLYVKNYLEERDKYAVFFGGNEPIIRAGSDVGNGRRLLVLKDSYANCFLSFALQDYAAIDIVDLRYFNDDLGDYLSQGLYTDILLLYNASGFAQDTSISKLALALRQEEPSS